MFEISFYFRFRIVRISIRVADIIFKGNLKHVYGLNTRPCMGVVW